MAKVKFLSENGKNYLPVKMKCSDKNDDGGHFIGGNPRLFCRMKGKVPIKVATAAFLSELFSFNGELGSCFAR